MAQPDDQSGRDERHEGSQSARGERERECRHLPSVPGNLSHVGYGFVPNV
jgi:hypothetical protein